jgi:cell division protein FtsQ
MVAAEEERFSAQMATLGFRVDLRKVTVIGQRVTPLASIVAALGLHDGEPILSLSLDEMQARVQALPRVKEADIIRLLPDRLRIRILEREPVAVWQHDGRLQLIDAEGAAMEEIGPGQYAALPLLVGEGAASHASEALALLTLEPKLAQETTGIVRVGERRWSVWFKNGMELKLPENGSAAAWRRFALLESQHHFLKQDLRSIDLRLADRIFMTPATEPPAPKQAEKKKGR